MRNSRDLSSSEGRVLSGKALSQTANIIAAAPSSFPSQTVTFPCIYLGGTNGDRDLVDNKIDKNNKRVSGEASGASQVALVGSPRIAT